MEYLFENTVKQKLNALDKEKKKQFFILYFLSILGIL